MTQTRTVSSEEVAAYQGMVEGHARRFAKLTVGGTRIAEFDDLVQEGLVATWEALRDGYWPSNLIVANAMRDWLRKEARRFPKAGE